MSDTTIIEMPDDRSTNFDWGAVIGGALVATALSFVLFAFGSAAGVASVSPYSWNNPSATTLTILGAAYVSVVMIGSFLAGGYFVGRYRRPVGTGVPKDEREARDGAHGLVMWALALLVGVGIAYCMTMMAARGAASGAAGVAMAASNTDAVSSAIDRMLRPSGVATGPGTRPQDSRVEIARVISTNTLTRGEITNDDRDYVARLVAIEAQIPQDDARKRVDSTIETAKQAANKARKVAAGMAFLIGALSVFAAGAAYWAAMAGGRHRQQNIWR